MKRAAPFDVISNRKKDCPVSGLSGIFCKRCRNSACACGKLGKVIAYQRIHTECTQVNAPDFCVGQDRCKRFLCIELVNDALLLTMAILGYSRYGLLGMGVGMTVASVLEVFVAAGFCRVAYGYKLSVAQLKIIFVHASIGVLTSLLTFVDNVWIYVSVGTLLLVLDLAYTLSIMRRHVDIDIVNRIKRKFVRRS